MIVKKQDVFSVCGVCHRTLLLGEQTARFTSGRDEWIDVCALCTEIASEQGWIREGSPTTPLIAAPPRRRKRLRGIGLLESRRSDQDARVVEPMLRKLSTPEHAMVEAAELFNASAYRRTVAGISRSLGEPRVSLLPLSGVNPEVVITVAWDISWYQYRVALDPAQSVKLAERGYELDELDARFMGWNGYLEGDGFIVPDIPRL